MFEELERQFGGTINQPLDYEMVWCPFWDKGIAYSTLEQLPLPYILSIMKSQQYVTKQQEKEMKKNR